MSVATNLYFLHITLQKEKKQRKQLMNKSVLDSTCTVKVETNLCGLFQCCLLFPRGHRARQGEDNLLSLHSQFGHVGDLDENAGPGRKVANTDSEHILVGGRERESERKGRREERERVRGREGGEIEGRYTDRN